MCQQRQKGELRPETDRSGGREKRSRKQSKPQPFKREYVVYIVLSICGCIGAGSFVFGIVGEKMSKMSLVLSSFCALLTITAELHKAVNDKVSWFKTLLLQGAVFLAVFIICSFIFLLLPYEKETKESSPESPENPPGLEEETAPVLVSERQASFQRMPFDFEKDVVFKNIVYYVDGNPVSEDKMAQKIEDFIWEQIKTAGFPERYESDAEKLNQGSYAAYTQEANEYFKAYKSVEAYKIDAEYKAVFLRKARENRKAADREYTTKENCWNIIWDCDAMMNVLSVQCLKEADDEKRKQLEGEIKECNRDILCAAWNILLIQYMLTGETDQGARNEMVKAYKWEKAHAPDEGVNYDALIDAFENLA